MVSLLHSSVKLTGPNCQTHGLRKQWLWFMIYLTWLELIDDMPDRSTHNKYTTHIEFPSKHCFIYCYLFHE